MFRLIFLTINLLLTGYFSVVKAQIPAPYNSTIKVNFARTWDAKRPYTDLASLIANGNPAEVLQTTQYLDGLGRPMETVIRQASPSKQDMVSAYYYDGIGREKQRFLPFTSTVATPGDATDDGKFKMNPFQQQTQFYSVYLNGQGQTYYYEQTDFESSPLNRVMKSMPAGNNWVGSNRGVSQSYEVNSANEVRIWNCTATGGYVPTSPGYYNAGELYRNVTTNEHGKRVVEYRDKQDRVILRKVEISSGAASILNHTGWLCTYYIYNDLDLLRWVIGPAGVEKLASTFNWVFDNINLLNSVIAREQCFVYGYDSRNRMIYKNVPGRCFQETIYYLKPQPL